MIQFLNPAWLWALAGMVIPIGIHLLSRKEGKAYLLGSTRFIRETSTSRFKSIRLNEVLLLLLRCLLILFLVLFLAGLTFRQKTREKWLLIEPGLEKNPVVASLRDTLSRVGYQVRYFSDGFPVEEDSAENPDYWGLVHALGRRPVEAVVASKQLVSNFRGERLSLPDNVRWIQVPVEQRDFVLETRGTDSRTMRRKGLTNEVITSLENEHLPAARQSADTIGIEIIYDPRFAYDKDILVSALKSIPTVSSYQLKVQINPPRPNTNAQWRFYFGVLPRKQERNTVRYSVSEYNDSPLLQRDYDSENSYIITNRLSPDLVLRERFTTSLARILLHDADSLYLPYPDLRVMPDNNLWAKNSDVTAVHATGERNTSAWLLVMFMTILIIERVVSRMRNQ